MTDFSDSATPLSIGDLTVHPDQRRVMRGSEELRLGKLTYDMLLALAERAPALVTQDELAERIWPGRAASPETIAQRLKILRQSLGDDAKAPRYIRVVRGQGYQLISRVARIDSNAPAAIPAKRWSRVGRLTLAGAMVAVVAVTSLIATRLNVAPAPVERESLQQPPTDSAEAHAIYLDVMAQFDVGRNVAGLDFQAMLEHNVERLSRAIELDPTFAQAHLLRGSQHAVGAEIARHGRPYFDAGRELEFAAADFERALAIDPSLGSAHSALASIDLFNGKKDKARERFEHALRLSPNDPSVLQAAAGYYLGESRRDEARALLLRAVEIEPNIAAASPTFDGMLIAAGALDTAAEFNRRFAEASPASIEAHLSLGYIEAIRGNRNSALERLDLGMRLLDQNPGALPGLPEWLAGLTYVYGRLGKDEEARRVFDRLVQSVPNEQHVNPVQWVRAYLGIGEIRRAYAWAEKLAVDPLPAGHSHELHFMLNSHNDPRLEQPEFVEIRRQLGYRD